MRLIENRDAQFMLLGGFIIAIGLVITTVILNSVIFEGNMAIGAGTQRATLLAGNSEPSTRTRHAAPAFCIPLAMPWTALPAQTVPPADSTAARSALKTLPYRPRTNPSCSAFPFALRTDSILRTVAHIKLAANRSYSVPSFAMRRGSQIALNSRSPPCRRRNFPTGMVSRPRQLPFSPQ